jgi:hypothetical protein
MRQIMERDGLMMLLGVIAHHLRLAEDDGPDVALADAGDPMAVVEAARRIGEDRRRMVAILAGITKIRAEGARLREEVARLREEVARLRAVQEEVDGLRSVTRALQVAVTDGMVPRGMWVARKDLGRWSLDAVSGNYAAGVSASLTGGWRWCIWLGCGSEIGGESETETEAMVAAEQALDESGIAFRLVEARVERVEEAEPRTPRGKWDGAALRCRGEIVAHAIPGGNWEIWRTGGLDALRTGFAATQEAAKLVAEEWLDAEGIPYDLLEVEHG